MIRSMTGFGRGRCESPDFHVQAELRSVNHRYLDIRLKLPFSSPELEARLREAIGRHVQRGKVDLSLVVDEVGEKGERLRVNRPLLRDYLRTLSAIQEELGLPGRVSLEQIATLPWGKVFEVDDPQLEEADFAVFEKAVGDACAQLAGMREKEGSLLRKDLEERLAASLRIVGEIEGASAGLIEATRIRLQERIQALAAEASLDPGRIVQEAAILADRSDVSEELTRLRMHLARIGETLRDGGDAGKKLDFLLQECHREANTVGSKGKGTELPRLVVDLKAVIEAMREQVQNLE